MKKLYFKKLVSGIKYALVFFLIYIFGSNMLVTIANFFKDLPILQLVVVMGIPALIVFAWASIKRLRDKDLGKAYKKAMAGANGLSAELSLVVKSNDYKAELWSGGTYALLIGAWLALPSATVALPIRLISLAIYFVLIFVVFGVGDLLSWLWVHGKFRKDDLL